MQFKKVYLKYKRGFICAYDPETDEFIKKIVTID